MKSIRPIEAKDIPAILRLSDKVFGPGYYVEEELENLRKRSQCGDIQYSLVMEVDGEIVGVRVTFPPGQWTSGKGEGLTPEKWPQPMEKTAYFQTIFMDPEHSGKGYGRELSQEAIKRLRKMGVRGVVCHSWKESPNGSSGKYLRALGFQSIKEHPEYWKNVDYLCMQCQARPCLCTAEEMYLEFL